MIDGKITMFIVRMCRKFIFKLEQREVYLNIVGYRKLVLYGKMPSKYKLVVTDPYLAA